MVVNPQNAGVIASTIAPWLSVRDSRMAFEFYKSAFGAVEVYLLDGQEKGVVARLSIDGAEFWGERRISRAWQFQSCVYWWNLRANDSDCGEPGCHVCVCPECRCEGSLSGERGTRMAGGARCRSVRAPLGDWAAGFGIEIWRE